MERIIGMHTGPERGALVVAFGAIHGNEYAGVLALQEIFRMLEREPEVNPGFTFFGKLVGLIGNRRAYSTRQRFIEYDLNRHWTEEHLLRSRQRPPDQLLSEDWEYLEILDLIHAEIAASQPETLVLLDLHTTSADGGIFCIPSDNARGLQLAKTLHAPVILGMLDGLSGTLLHYAAGGHLRIGQFPHHAFGAAFEAGQHDDTLSVSRSIAAVVNCLRAAGCIRQQDMDNRHASALKAYSDPLPKVARLRHIHRVQPGDAFRMRPGYVNFQAIRRGEHLADDATGPVVAPEDGLILMPLYQPLGNDGFFLVREIH